jgi:RNA polymerase sigma-70 factor (ECF subfamily)
MIPMPDSTRAFDTLIAPWLDAGYNLARWLLRDETAADDALQDAALRAYRYLDNLREGDPKPWFLGIVRNVCMTHFRRKQELQEIHGLEDAEIEHHQWHQGLSGDDPAADLSRRDDMKRVDVALQSLSAELREVVVLRELEGLSYAEIAQVTEVPLGTVMSRLARARTRLRAALLQSEQGP